MRKRDYYDVLGVDRQVDAATLKKAFRKKALEYHPDRNAGPEAEEKFKELAEAYQVLSDPDARARYDVGGFGAVDGRGVELDPSAFVDFTDIFSAFGDLFGMGFGPFGGRGGRRSRVQRGDDVLVEVKLRLEEACLGVEKEVRAARLERCAECAGSGARKGSGQTTCPECGGRGQVFLRQGFVALSRTCGRCRGEGHVLRDPCPACDGRGRAPRTKTLGLKIPAGIGDGQRIRVTGEGSSGAGGGPPGDLYVAVAVEPHAVLERDGDDLHVTLPLSFPQVALGATVEVPGLTGNVKLDVKPGTQSGDVLRVRGEGVPRLGGTGRGDLLVHVRVRTPKRLSAKQAELLKAYAAAVNEHYDVGEDRSLFERVRDAFSS